MIPAFLLMIAFNLGRLLFALVTGRAMVGLWERADRRSAPVFFWGICAIDVAAIIVFAAIILGWRPFAF